MNLPKCTLEDTVRMYARALKISLKDNGKEAEELERKFLVEAAAELGLKPITVAESDLQSHMPTDFYPSDA